MREYMEMYMYEQYKKKLAYKYTRMYKYEKYKRALTSLLRENSRGIKGGLEGWSSEWSAGGPRYRCATLGSKGGNPHAPGSRTWT